MPEGEGLFSGLKFTDVFFPAAAAAASMYNPYIGRGLQTGMNLFNTMAGFQDSARYYKQLQEDREREDAGKQKATVSLSQHIARLREQEAGIAGRPGMLEDAGPLLDESQTSQFGMFGDEGPELPDPDQQAAVTQSLGDMGPEAPGEFGLGLEAIRNPRFSEIHAEELAMSEQDAAELAAIQDQIANQELYKGYIDLAPGSALQQSGLSAYRGLDARYRDAERIKDLQSNFDYQDRAAKLAILERQAQLQQVKDVSAVHRAAQEEAEAASRKVVEMQMTGGDGNGFTRSRQDTYEQRMYMALLASRDPDIDDVSRQRAEQRAISMAIKMMEAGLEPPVWIQDLLAAHFKKQDAAGVEDYTKKNREQEERVRTMGVDENSADAFLAKMGIVR